MHARLIDRLRAAGVKVIAYDVQFTEPTEAAEDNALIEAIAKAGNVVLATTEVDDSGRSNVLGGDDVVRDIGARVGDAVALPEPGGVVRRMSYSPQGLKSFAVVAAEVESGRTIGSETLGGRTAPIDYLGPPGTIESVSFSRVLQGRIAPDRLRGKIAVVGATAPSLQDVHPTPTTGNELMSGPEIQANAIDTARRRFPLQPAPEGVNVALILLMALVPPMAGMRLRPLPGLGAVAAVGVMLAVGVQIAFDAGRITAFTYPLLALLLATLGTLAVYYLLEALERQRVRTLFARFVPEEVVGEVLARTDDDLRLGATSVTATIMFTDIRGFTTFSESRPPEQVLDVLNVYLEAMSGAIMDNGGTLVSYMGDGILAVFGAPIAYDDHADRALHTARQMLSERLESVNAWMQAEGLGDGFNMGIGLHTGQVMSGNIGSARRIDYTVIGDTVNTASRLEGMTKGTGHMLYLSESTRATLQAEPDDLIFVDELPVRGRAAPIRVWSVA